MDPAGRERPPGDGRPPSGRLRRAPDEPERHRRADDAELLALEAAYPPEHGISTVRLRASALAGRGRRVAGARLLLRDAVERRDPGAVLRAAAAVSPRRLAGRPERVPPSWRRDAEAWLAVYRDP